MVDQKEIISHTHHKKTFVEQVRSNPWMLSTFVLVIVLVIFLVTGGLHANKSSVGESVVSYLNGQTGGGVVLKSVEEESGLYKITVTYQGSDIPVYATSDGKNLVSSITPLDGSGSVTAGEPTGPVTIDSAKIAHAPSIGNANAPVTIVEFSDFSCPFCGAASGHSEEYVNYMKSNDPTWQAPVTGIIENDVKEGKVRFVMMYFPGHGTGQQAQLVGWCLNDQKSELYWKFHDLAFADQTETNDLTAMKELAKKAGANMNALDSCLSSKKYDSYLTSDTDYGRSIGVSGTPAFFVNGQLVSGAVSYTQIEQVIDQEYAKATA